MSSIEPKCNSYLEPCLQPDVMRSTGGFFWGGKKRTTSGGRFFQFPRKNHPRFTLRFFFHVMFVQRVFPKEKIGWSTSSFTRRLVKRMFVGEASSGVMVMLICSFHSPFDDFGGLLGPGV